jgi:hypothetical protein
MWKALEALTDAFAPIVGKPTYRFSFKLTIVQQTCHRITIAANSENEARALALSEARHSSRWLAPLTVLAHERLTESFQVIAIERRPPPPPSDDDLLWPSIMP